MITRRTCLQSLALPLVLTARTSATQANSLSQFVNLRIGTGGHGHTYPGATVPFGAVQLSPDTGNAGWDWCSGYHDSDRSMFGFSHTHLSGTGIGDMLDVLLVPAAGPVDLARRRMPFSHNDEKLEPGYYSVQLRQPSVLVELTAAERTGFHRYTVGDSGLSHFLLDFAHGYSNTLGGSAEVLAAEMKLLDDRTVVGGRRVGDWAKGRHIYFAMRFSKAFASVDLFSSGGKQAGSSVSGTALQCVLHYPVRAGDNILVKTGISGVSIEGALKNLAAEIPAWDFDGVRRAAATNWERQLSKIRIETLDVQAKTIFYTALYHSMLAPTLFDDVDGRYRGMDGQVHELPSGSHNYSTFSLWDTYRAAHPLFTLIHPERVPDMVNCLIRMARESREGVPVWPLQGVETGCMTGYHSAPVIAEAIAKGFPGIDVESAYAVLRERADVQNYRGLGWYRKLGYVPCDQVDESVSKTLEYAYDDWAVACVARAAGHSKEADRLAQRSRNYRNLFHAEFAFMRPRLANGDWAEPFEPKSMGHSKRWHDFTECNAWQATFLVQHRPEEYVDFFGGSKRFVEKLDALFEQSSVLPPDSPPDIAGLAGQYAHGNEPSHHIAFLYAYAGAPEKTQQRVRFLLQTMYRNAPDGLTGNEDCGQMSAWYVMSALGFYAVDPTSGRYVVCGPLFDKAVVVSGAEASLTVEARRHSPSQYLVALAELNGRALDDCQFHHADLKGHSTLVFTMKGDGSSQA